MKSIRRSSKIGLSLFAAGVSVLAFVGTASAQDAAAKCASTLTCSSGKTDLKAESRQRLDTDIEVSWKPNNNFELGAKVAIDPIDSKTPLYTIDMSKGAVIDATWPEKDGITLKIANGGATDGSFKVTHTIAPVLWLRVFGISIDYSIPSSLLDKIPGGRFEYLATGEKKFMPWGFERIENHITPPGLNNMILTSVSFEQLGLMDVLRDHASCSDGGAAPCFDRTGDDGKILGIALSNMSGSLGIAAKSDITFGYKTTKILLQGQAQPLTLGQTIKVPGNNQDAIDIVADVMGEIDVKGKLGIAPALQARLGSISINFAPTVIDKDFTSKAPVPVPFAKKTIHIPLPNLAVPTSSLAFGAVRTNTQAQKTVELNNTGELGAMVNIESSDPNFTVSQPSVMTGPKSKISLQVNYKPSQDGEHKATITVRSNDPDSPVQTFEVSGSASPTAAPGGNEEEDPGLPQAAGDDGGCGCKLAGNSTSSTGLVGLGLLGLGFAAVVARRRRR